MDLGDLSYVWKHFWGFPVVKIHSSIPIDTHKIRAVAPDNTWEILSHPNGGQIHDKLALNELCVATLLGIAPGENSFFYTYRHS